MSEWKECQLGELIEVKYGKDHKRLGLGDIPVYGSGGIMRNGDNYLYDKPSVLIPRKGTLSNIFYVDKPFWTVDTMFWTKIDTDKVLPKFLYYSIKDYKWDSLNVGSAVPSLTVPVIEGVSINLPPINVQKNIISILSALDDKIAVNRRICENLEAQAQALFKHWFVDFAPFKDGKFVESELGMIPEGWRVGTLFDVAEVHDSKRVPLSSMQRAHMDKIYPYYGATDLMDYVDDYIFDGDYILMGEDGSVVQDDGTPFIQYVSGKIWVNNHAHVLTGNNGFSTELLIPFLKKYNIKGLVTGAVQAKLSQANMKKILIAIPPAEILSKANDLVSSLYKQIKLNNQESQRLSTLRDTLLPKLMSGQIEV